MDEPLGEGSYGKVYRIRREDLGVVQYAALKWIALPFNAGEIDHLRSEGMTEPEIHTYFTAQAQELGKEIELMSRVKGTGYIVSYEDHLLQPRSGEVGWDILIRMELLTPLPKYLQEERTIRDVVKLGLDICSALILCRQHRIIHRDIKLDNIFISGNGDFKLGDFGVARQMERTQGYFSRKGTNYYMAPEVYHGKAYDATVDIYSLGLVLYRLLNRQRLPFTSSTARILSPQDRDEAFARRIGGEPLPPPLLGGPRLQKAVLTACAYDPKKRYRTPEAFRSALEEAAAGSNLSAPLSILSAPTPSGSRDARSRSGNRSGGHSSARSGNRSSPRAGAPARKRLLWPWLTGGAVLLAVAAGLFLWRWPGSPLARPAVTATPDPSYTTTRLVETEVRENASLDAPLITSLPADTPVRLQLQAQATDGSTWFQVTYGDNQQGYVPAEALHATSRMPQVAAAPAPTMRPAPRATPASPTPSPDPTPAPTPEQAVTPKVVVLGGAELPVSTAAVTAAPTPAPTQAPTPVPTAEPTTRPTGVPTARPSPEPTTRPTGTPTASPSPAPTRTPKVTAAPTAWATPGSDFLITNGILTAYVGSGGDIIIPKNVEAIGDAAFRECTALTGITLPDSLSSIGQDAFYGCTALKEVTLPDSLRSIGNYAFLSCTALHSITIPSNVTRIGIDAFGDTGLSSIEVVPGNPAYASLDGVLFDARTSMLHTYPHHKAGSAYTVPDGTLAIHSYAFDNPALTKVTLPDTLTAIHDGAFYRCFALSEIFLPDSLASIGDFAFSESAPLTIYGSADSPAQRYAEAHGKPFISTGGASPATPAEPLLIDHAPVRIEARPESITFSLTVENLPETFRMNMKDTDIGSGEYRYGIDFFDGTNGYSMELYHIKFTDEAETTGSLQDLSSALWIQEPDGTTSTIAECPLASVEGNTLTWVLPLPVKSWGSTYDIAYDSITHFGYGTWNAAEKEWSGDFFQVGEGGTVQKSTESLRSLVENLAPAATPTPAPAEVTLGDGQGTSTVIDYAPVYIEANSESITFSLTVEDLPETFRMNSADTEDYYAEFGYGIEFFDGNDYYGLSALHYKHPGEAEREGTLRDAESSLIRWEEGQGYTIAACPIYSIEGGTITWVLPLPVQTEDGPVDIAYDAITHFGYEMMDGETFVSAGFEITAEGVQPLETDLYDLFFGEDPGAEAASAEPAPGTVIDHPPVYIKANSESITLSLTVEDLPESFLLNRKDANDKALEYRYGIEFFDGTNAFMISADNIKAAGSEEIEGTLWDMDSSLMRLTSGTEEALMGSYPIESIVDNTITWVLPLPMKGSGGGTFDIAYDTITHFGYWMYNLHADNGYIKRYFEITEDGSVQELDVQSLGSLLSKTTPTPAPSSTPAPEGLTPYAFRDATVERMARALLGKEPSDTIYLEEWSGITRMMVDNEAFSSRYYEEFYQSEILTLEDFRHCTKLTDLTLSNQNLPDLSPLADMESLETLVFDGCTLGSLSPIASLPRLRILGFQSMQLESLEPLSGLHSLVSLVAFSCEISDISPLYGLELFSLFLENNNIRNVSPLRDMTSLQILDLSNNKITDTSPLLPLQQAGTTITLAGNPVTDVREQSDTDSYSFRDPAVGTLARAMLGKKQTADVTVAEWKSIQHFPGTPALLAEDSKASLKLYEMIRENPIHSLEDFQLCGNLESLYLEDAAITDLSPLTQVPSLQTLTLIGTKVVDFSPLSELPALTTLYAGYREFLGIDVATLPTGLSSLSLYYCGASDLSFLESFDNLQHLELTGFPFEPTYATSSAAQSLSDLARLESLSLIACDVRDISFLRRMPGLRTLDLSHNGSLSDLSALSALSQIRSLHLSGCSLADIAPLQTLSGLKYLDLRDNQIVDTAPLYLLSKSGAEILLEGNPAEKVEAPTGDAEFAPVSPYYLVTEKTVMQSEPSKSSDSLDTLSKGALLSAVRVVIREKELWLQITFELDYLDSVLSGYVRLEHTTPYDLDKAYTWNEYKKIVEAAANACHGAQEFIMPSPRLVTGHPSKKEMLTIPTWMPFTIEGGCFEGMALNTGTFILKGVTIRSTHDDSPAIYLSGATNANVYLPARYAALGLTLDADCVIEATGENSPAIDISSKHAYLMQFSISNAGTLRSEKAEGMRLHVNEAPGGTTFRIANTGDIQSGTDGITGRITGMAEDFRFILENEGSIHSANTGVEVFCALQNPGKIYPVISIRNDGEIISSGSYGVVLSSNRPGYDFGGYAGGVENGGTIQSSGAYAPILLDTSFEHPAQLTLRNTGTLIHSADADLGVEFWSSANAKALSDASHESERALLRQWLEQAGFFQLEQPATAEAVITYATPPADPKMHESGPGTHFSFRSEE